MSDPKLSTDPCPQCGLREPHLHRLISSPFTIEQIIAFEYVRARNRIIYPWLSEIDP